MAQRNPKGRERFQWIEAVMASPELNDAEKVVLVRLGHFCNDETGQCDPSVATIARKTHRSERSVWRILSSAQRKGWLSHFQRHGRNGVARSNAYLLMMSNVSDGQPPCHGCQGSPAITDRETPTGRSGSPCHHGQTNNNQNNSPNHNRNIGGSDGGPRSPDFANAPLHERQARELVDEIATEICRLDDKQRQKWLSKKAIEHVTRWLEAGMRPFFIIAGCATAMGSKKDGPPNSILYFEQPIIRFYMDSARPLPGTNEAGPVTFEEAMERAHRKADAAAERRSLQKAFSEIAEAVGGWGLLEKLSENELMHLGQRWLNGEITYEEIEQLRRGCQSAITKAAAG